MLKKIFSVLLVLIASFIVFVASRPSEFRVSRSVLIPAPTQQVFSKVNDLKEWENWSPWAKIDPACKTTYSGSASGVGAEFAWAGNNKVGEGKMTIVDSKPSELVRIKLDFIKPFSASNMAEFNFKAVDQQTEVTWSMYGQNGFLGKAISIFMNCDKMLGAEFEKGLNQLKQVSTRNA